MATSRASMMETEVEALERSTADLQTTLDREFDDYAATRERPALDDPRGHARYLENRRRMALASPVVGIEGATTEPSTSPAQSGQQLMGLSGFMKSSLSLKHLSPIMLGAGLYDFYPPELPPKGSWRRQPFKTPFNHQKQAPANGTLLLSVPQVGSGRFYASATTLESPTDRYAQAWCGTVLPIDPNLHNEAEGPKDVVVWAEGTMTYDYALSGLPGPSWNSRPVAAAAQVDVLVRLLRYSRQSGQLLADPDAILSYLAGRRIMEASLTPNAATASPPSSSSAKVGGSYAGWSSGPTNFAIDLPHGRARKLETDSTYQIAVLCSVSLSALSGPSPASAEVSAQMFLRLVTLGILPHDPSVPF